MPTASSLRDLLRIRERNARLLRSQPGYLGSAVGHKYIEHETAFALDANKRPIPAVLLFVDEKPMKSGGKPLAKQLVGPAGLTCATDVITGIPKAHAATTGGTQPDPANMALLRQLKEDDIGIIGGIPLSSPFSVGTGACVVRRRGDGALGLLTNWHVAGPVGSRILQPPPRIRLLGVTARTTEAIDRKSRKARATGGVADYSDATYRSDAALVLLEEEAAKLARPGVHSLGPLEAPHRIDLDSDMMDLLGSAVVGIGQRLGSQTGTIMAYGYEWRPDRTSAAHEITDFLILGDGPSFAALGDSGKLVLTGGKSPPRPLALLWGGEHQQFWAANAQQTWNYASAITPALDALGVDLLSSYPAASKRPLRARQNLDSPMNQSSLTLRYIGSANDAGVSNKLEAHYNGQVAIHTKQGQDGQRLHLVSVQGGPHVLYTLPAIDIRLLHGSCEVSMGKAAPKKLRPNQNYKLDHGSSFTIKTEDFAQLLCTPKLGPGMGSDGGEACVLE